MWRNACCTSPTVVLSFVCCFLFVPLRSLLLFQLFSLSIAPLSFSHCLELFSAEHALAFQMHCHAAANVVLNPPRSSSAHAAVCQFICQFPCSIANCFFGYVHPISASRCSCAASWSFSCSLFLCSFLRPPLLQPPPTQIR